MELIVRKAAEPTQFLVEKRLSARFRQGRAAHSLEVFFPESARKDFLRERTRA
jgi:hypothetical protein